jgi:hypothetical protein
MAQKQANVDLALQISNKIVDLYDFHSYEVPKERIVELTKLILKAEPGITEDEVDLFFEKVKLGEYGTLFKAPSALMNMFQQHRSYLVASRIRILPNID